MPLSYQWDHSLNIHTCQHPCTILDCKVMWKYWSRVHKSSKRCQIKTEEVWSTTTEDNNIYIVQAVGFRDSIALHFCFYRLPCDKIFTHCLMLSCDILLLTFRSFSFLWIVISLASFPHFLLLYSNVWIQSYLKAGLNRFFFISATTSKK